MKLLLSICLFLITVSIPSKDEKTNANCNLEMTKKEILSKPFNDSDCIYLKSKTITSFKIKVPKYKTVSVKGELLNAQATNNITKAEVGDTITIFDILVNSDEKVAPLIITITD